MEVRNNPPGGAGNDNITSVSTGETFLFARWHLSRDEHYM